MEGLRPSLASEAMTAVGWMPAGGREGGRNSSRALANARYGFSERNKVRPGAWTSGATIIAAARVLWSLRRYLGFERNVSWLSRASSLPATPVISRSPAPSKVQPRRAARSSSFINFPFFEAALAHSKALARPPVPGKPPPKHKDKLMARVEGSASGQNRAVPRLSPEAAQANSSSSRRQ